MMNQAESGSGASGPSGLWAKRWPAEPADAALRASILAAVGTDEHALLRDSRRILDWVRSHPDARLRGCLAPPDRDDRALSFIQSTLVCAKNDEERTKRTFERLVEAQAAYPRLFPEDEYAVTAEDFHQVAKWLTITAARRLTATGERVLVVRPLPGHVDSLDIELCNRVALVKGMCALFNDLHSTVCVVLDMTHLCARHVLKAAVNLRTVQAVLYCALTVMPMRVRMIHFVNTPAIFSRLMSIFLPFLKEKMRHRIIIHKSVDSLHEMVSPEHLPADLNGKLPSCQETEEEIVQAVTS